MSSPFPVGAHLSTPIVLKDGTPYGTLCCFSCSPSEQLRHADLKNLRYCAQLVARKLELTGAPAGRTPTAANPNWTLQPVQRRP
ncbi:GAF domain-containing protein [Caldimonas brevitalea]|uniref:GAF domain-containing protein n=1 Tax=Caldimonas brevitalea TaxID=413882 RepID=A0A0G3BGY2_9BURK|nr:GAF domain-containing protein [Caldimonas brevitalea]AKJ28597.1 hypothetical protein AAW51_1906 [Caldimonas brevitalea]